MNWTEKQRETIETRGKNILVAAAAGSGKTAVLVERIRRMAMEEGIPLDSMLIVTFTRAAAAEMKEKIRRSLKAKLEEDPSAREQLERLSRAQISTFHSFSLDVVRHFFFLTDLEPDISICDDTKSKLMKEEALDELFQEAFARDDEAFYTLLDWYGNEKNDGRVREIISSLYDTLMALPSPFETLDEKIQELTDYRRSEGWAYRKQIIRGKLERAAEASEKAWEVLVEAGLDRLAEKYEDERKTYRCMATMAEAEDYSGLARLAAEFPRMSLRGKKDEEETWKEVKPYYDARREVAKKLRGEVTKGFLGDEETELAEIASLVPVAKTLCRVLKDFHLRFKTRKMEQKLVDFNDIEHYCLEILQDPDARRYYREKLRYIFVDEYQDTSVMQEAIIDAISGKDNVFMVGDVKQSIYKFRLAEPEIFRERYERYGEGAEDAVRIDLNRNFRSKPVILDWINDRFTPLMEGYDEAARLYPGIDCPEEFAFRPEIRLLAEEDETAELDEELQEMQKDEKEAHLVCNIIEENLGKPFFDSKAPGGGCVRPMAYRDMAVLMRSVANTGPVFQDVMRQRGIPVFVDDNKGYYDTIEIGVMMNLLSVIDNRYRDVPLLSVLRSEIFGFSTEELADIRLRCPEGSYAEAFLQVAGGQGDALAEKAGRVAGLLERWRGLANTMPLPDYVWMLLRESGYYILTGTMPRGDLRQANLRRLVDLTVEFGKTGQASLYGFVKYIDSVRKDKKIDIGQVRLLSENDDVVRMMTIHKSKGLEFPLVIVAGICKRLQYTDSKQKVRFHKDVGLGMFLEDPEHRMEKKTLAYRLVLEKLKEEEREEHKRVLYVAMTRARDRLYLTGVPERGADLLDDKEAGNLSDTTYLGMMPSVEDVVFVEASELLEQEKPVPEHDPDPFPEEGPLEGELRSRLAYRYPYEESARIRSKYSVSALNAQAHRPAASMEEPEEELPDALGEFHEPPEEIPVPHFLAPKQKLTGAERGTIYHKIMETIDFQEVAEGGGEALAASLERMEKEEILLPNERKAVDPMQVLRFFDSSLGKRCVRAAAQGMLYREQSFVLSMERCGEQTGVQGVIDAFFLEGEQIVLLDYKTNRVDPEKPFEDEAARIAEMYREQQAIYAEALEKATGLAVAEKWLYLSAAGKAIRL